MDVEDVQQSAGDAYDDTETRYAESRRRYAARTAGKAYMRLPHDPETVQAIQRALERGKRILIAGGAAGSLGPRFQQVQREGHLVHLVSTERHGDDATWTMKPDVGVVLASRYLSVALTRAIEAEGKRLSVPVYGLYTSFGTIQRTLTKAFYPSEVAAADREPTTPESTTVPVYPDPVHPDPLNEPLVQPVIQPAKPTVAANVIEQAILDQFEETRRMLREVQRTVDQAMTSVQLCEDAVIDSVRKAHDNNEAAQQLQQLRKLLQAL